jgi:molybdopterin-containing oxidoreductase family membrane subunit
MGMDFLYRLGGILFIGYTPFSLLLIILVFVFKHRLNLRHFLSISNTVLLCASIMFWIYWMTELFIAWYSGAMYEQYAFSGTGSGPWWYYLIWAGLCALLLPQIMWFRYCRKSLWVTVVTLVLINYWVYAEFLSGLLFIPRPGKDYLTSSHTTTLTITDQVLGFCTYAILVGIVYLMQRKFSKTHTT